MAAFVDCTKYNSDKSQTDRSIDNLTQQGELASNQIAGLQQRAEQSEQCCARNREAIQAVERKVDAGVKVTAPLNGKGTAEEPLGLNLGAGLTTDSNGNLLVGAIPPDNIRNFTTNKYKLGMSTFFGNINKDTGDFVAGVPIDIGSDEPTQGRATSLQQVTGRFTKYDFNGYYIATPHQVDVWLQGVGETAWYIMNDEGLNSDGTLVNPNGWGLWQKLDNVSSITNETVTRLQNQVNGLGTELTAARSRIDELERLNRQPCRIPTKHVSGVSEYTLLDTDGTITIASGTIVVPYGLGEGRVFTIIHTSDEPVLLRAGDPRVKLTAPNKGSLRMAGNRAVVSVIYEVNSDFQYVQVAGQTQPS